LRGLRAKWSADQLLRTAYGSSEPHVIHRLEQIIQCVHFKGADSVLLVSGQEDDGGHVVPWETPKDLKAVHPRHLNIKKDYIWRQLENRFYGGGAIAAFPDNLNVLELSQPEHHTAPRQRLIVDN
jgi:hypothetical protein